MSECNHDCGSCGEDCPSRQSPQDFLEKPNELSHIHRVIGVVSGKGGVGKSLVTSLLAVQLNRRGYKTGIMDADVTGPSIPKAFGIHQKAVGTGSALLPVKSKTGVEIMSINLLLENESDPVVWRGPIIAGVVKQFWTDVIWDDVDFLFVDMPPGTGDVPLTVFQSIPLDGIIVVASPQELVEMVVEKAVADGDLIPEDHFYWQAFSIEGRRGSIAFNCPEFFEHIDGTSVRDLTLAQINGKRAIMRQMAFYRKCLRGFEHAWVSEIAPMVGVRESREIDTDYVLTAEDLFLKRKFDDMFCQSNYPIDVHGEMLSNTLLDKVTDDGKPWYEIPFRCLTVKGFDNLMVAGRCLGAEFAAEASVRVQQSARSSGEAAGIGAAMALRQGVAPREIDGAEIRARMVALGAKYAQ